MDSPFKYLDSASARVLTTDLSRKLEGEKVAIIGLGGTGAFLLDLVATTWVESILLFDGDKFKQHNAFRCPGPIYKEDFRDEPNKALFHQARYADVRTGIRAIGSHIDESNVHLLTERDTVFLCMDGSPTKELILEACVGAGVLFIDCGMGVHRTELGGPLMGTMRVTTCLPDHHSHARACLDFAGDDELGEYERNAQMAELNSLNAALAVIKWKKMRGFYNDLGRELDANYVLDGNRLINRYEMELECRSDDSDSTR